MINNEDLTGQKFGRLTVIKYLGRDKNYRKRWECKCDCGNNETIAVISYNLKNGNTQSCGCLQKEKTAQANKTHQLSNHRIYHIWNNMLARCYNLHSINYNNYGGRGIKVCDEWLIFENFMEWAFANNYQDDLTIDRIDNNDNYCPENCRWVNQKEQQNNKSTNHFLTFNNETLTISQWSEKVKIDKRVLQYRIAHSWDIEKALFTPVQHKVIKRKEHINANH